MPSEAWYRTSTHRLVCGREEHGEQLVQQEQWQSRPLCCCAGLAKCLPALISVEEGELRVILPPSPT